MTTEKLQNQPEIFRISRIFGAFYEIYNPVEGYKRAVLRGKMRLDKGEERNPIAVGDFVNAEKKDNSDHTILSRLERKNSLVRKSEQGESHVLCANVDMVAIIASLQNPETKLGFIDRSIAACFHAGIQPLILFTKKDLVSRDEEEEKVLFYRELGYKVLSISSMEPDSLLPVHSELSGQTTYFVGISGSGKSTLINSLLGNDTQKVNSISESSGKGKHTTTNSLLLVLGNSGYIIDSPGIKEWGIFHIPRETLLCSYPELRSKHNSCSRPDCCSLDANCPMLHYLDSGELLPERQISIISMLDSLERTHKIRTGNLKSGKVKGFSKKSTLDFT